MDKKVVLITGGSRGIGRELAREYLDLGHIIYIVARNKEKLETSSKELDESGKFLKAIAGDVSDPSFCKGVIDQIIKEQNRLDILINNAGMAMRGLFKDTKVEVFEKLININYLGAAYLTNYAYQHLVATKGSVIFISTIAAIHGLAKVGGYGASKAPLSILGESIRAEVSSKELHVGIIYVGLTENDQDKVVYSSDGSLIPLDKRKNSHTQKDVALAIIKAVNKRKKRVVLTPLGKLAALFYRYFPRLADFLINNVVAKSSLYADSKLK